MIRLCPFCGYSLSRTLTDGITTCDNCCRVFDSSPYHKTLSASWVARKWYIHDPEMLKAKFGFSDSEIDPVWEFVIMGGMCHDEFLKVLDEQFRIDRIA